MTPRAAHWQCGLNARTEVTDSRYSGLLAALALRLARPNFKLNSLLDSEFKFRTQLNFKLNLPQCHPSSAATSQLADQNRRRIFMYRCSSATIERNSRIPGNAIPNVQV